MKQKLLMPILLAILFCINSSNLLGQIRADITESFDGWSDVSYGTLSTYDHSGVGQWESYNSMCNSSNARSGNCVRFNDDSGENEYLLFKGLDGNGKDGGVETISFWYRHWDGDASNVQFKVQYKVGSDGNWTDIGSIVTVPNNTTYYEYSESVNVADDNIFIQVISIDDAERLCIDDFSITDYSAYTPVITMSTATLTDFSYIFGSGPSTEQSFTVEGSNLTTDITLTAPTNYEISETSGTGYTSLITLTQASGTVSTTTIYTRLKAGLAVGDYNSENITASSTDATSKTVTCSGYVYEQIDWANLQWPGSGTITLYNDYNVYARVYEPGITDAVGQGTGITVWIGYSTNNTDPATWTDWVSATYLGDDGTNNDEYIANLGSNINATGTYYYASRFQLNSAPYIYGGYSGGFWDGTNNISGSLTVEALPQIDWANLQWPENGSVNVGGNFDVYAQVYEPGVTDATGQGSGITTWIGYSTNDTDPSTWTNWISASYNDDSGNNDEYKANLSSLLPSGTYYYASRFQLGLADYVYGGFNGGFWDGTTNVSGELTVSIVQPTNHPTAFTVSANSSSTLTVGWTDAVPFAENYLIKGSNISFADIIDPVDGVDEPDGLLVQNIEAGIETFQFTGLTASTNYYFKIYPYNGTETSSDYKTDDIIQTATGTTADLNTNLIISEVTDPNDIYQAKFVEIYNLGSTSIDFSTETWYLSRQANGNSTSWADIQLSGTITIGGTFVLSFSQSNFVSNYEFEAELYNIDISGNGNDGYFLYQGGDHSSGTLIDAYGVIDIDGTGEYWEYSDTKAVRLRSVTSPNSTWTASEWNIPASADVANMTPSEHNEDITWQGTTDNDWNTKGDNWSGTYGFIPDASFNVTIPATGITNYPTIGAEAACNNIIMQSTSASDASLIGQENLTIYGTTTIQRYATAGMWHGISAPSSGNTFQNLYFNGSPDVWAASYDEATNEYVYANDLATSLGEMKGWMTWIDGSTAQTFEFTGTLRNGPVSSGDLYNSGHDTLGYHFIGNPYPSAIDWDASGWTKTNIDAGIWVLDGATGQFVTYSVSGGTSGGSQYIPMGQGFFVQVPNNGITGSIEATSDVQVHSTEAFRTPQATTTPNLLKLKVADGELYDEAIIHLNASATADYDGQLDMHKLFSFDAENPQIFSTANNFMTVNCLPLETSMVKMDVIGKDGNELTISISEVNDFQEIYLSDEFTGTQTNLIEESYTFTYSETVTDRFRVYLGTVDIAENTAETVKVFSYDNNIHIVAANTNARIEIINMLGQKVATTTVNSGTKDITMYQSGYYMVIVTTENGQKAHKVMVNL